MIESRKKRTFIYFLFALYFFIYGVSPLSFTCNGDEIRSNSVFDKASTAKNGLHVFLIDYILSCITDRETASDHDAPVKILVRKARAVLSKNAILKVITLEKIAIAAISLLIFIYVLPHLPSPAFARGPLMGSYRQFSDLSPPLQ